MILDLLQPHTVKIYNLASKSYELQDVPARALLVGQRFDLFAKLYYIRKRKENSEQALSVYNEHIKVFNPDLREPGRDDKNGYDDFVSVFDGLIDDLGVNGFDAQKSIVPVDEDGVILDGAHRVSVLAYFGQTVRMARFKDVRRKADFDYEYFLRRGLSWEVADIIAHEMTQWLPNMLVACLWPRMGNEANKQQAISAIAKHYPVFYTKTVRVDFQSFVRLITKVYEKQSWVGNETNGFAGARDKAMNCYGSSKQVTFVLIAADDIEKVVEMKENIRAKFHSDKHSIHITDNVEETKDIAKIIFDAEGLNSWNQRSRSMLYRAQAVLQENLFFFKHVTLIKWKVTVASVLSKIR